MLLLSSLTGGLCFSEKDDDDDDDETALVSDAENGVTSLSNSQVLVCFVVCLPVFLRLLVSYHTFLFISFFNVSIDTVDTLKAKAKAYNTCRAPQAATATSEALVMSQAKLAWGIGHRLVCYRRCFLQIMLYKLLTTTE